MRPRTIAIAAVVLALCSALMISGCSQAPPPPPPTVDNTLVSEPKSVEATLGIETTVTVGHLTLELEAAGLKVDESPTEKVGLFNPATYLPLDVDGAFLQTYRFKSAAEAKGAAQTVEADG